MRVVVDFDRCQGFAICMSNCSEVFEIDDEGVLCLVTDRPPDSLRLRVDEAARQCPTQAISIED